MTTLWACLKCDRLLDLVGLLDNYGHCYWCREESQ